MDNLKRMRSGSSYSSSLIVVTDLDGTLLDHHNYSFCAALPVLERLKRRRIPVVANTSKSRREWLAMRSSFSNREAYVIENGSAVFFPDGQEEIHGRHRSELLNLLAEFRSRFRFRGFQELGLAGVSKHTGLPEALAEQASSREFSEPLLWEDTEKKEAQFCREISQRGFRTLKGGRFLHLQGETDKGRALPSLRDFYQAETIIALGDSPNDLAMIEQADIGVLVSSPSHPPLEAPKAKRLIRTDLQGPEAWAEIMTRLLDELKI